MENKDDVREMMPEEDEKAEFGKRPKVVFKKKVCKFCSQNLQIDYKNPDSLRRSESFDQRSQEVQSSCSSSF